MSIFYLKTFRESMAYLILIKERSNIISPIFKEFLSIQGVTGLTAIILTTLSHSRISSHEKNRAALSTSRPFPPFQTSPGPSVSCRITHLSDNSVSVRPSQVMIEPGIRLRLLRDTASLHFSILPSLLFVPVNFLCSFVASDVSPNKIKNRERNVSRKVPLFGELTTLFVIQGNAWSIKRETVSDGGTFLRLFRRSKLKQLIRGYAASSKDVYLIMQGRTG